MPGLFFVAIQTLRSRLRTLDSSRVRVLDRNPEATPRQRGRPWMRRRTAWLKAHPFCCHCEERGHIVIATEVDHVVPLVQGGADDESNLQGLCSPCHKAKTALEAGKR